MLVSITKSAAAVLLVGSAVLVGAQNARADMMAGDSYEAAMEQCQSLMKGQRSFCMINAYNQYKLQSAAEMKKEGTLVVDNNTSNDTPAETTAKEYYNAEASRCASLSKGQRSFCMINAENDYMKARSQ